MNDPAFDVLAQRVGRLEREVKYWRIGITGALAVLVIIGLLTAGGPAAAPGVVEASKLVIRDKTGKVRATMEANYSFDFSIFDEDGKSIAALSQWGLYFFWGSERARASMFWNGDPVLHVTDKQGKVIWKAP